jgi:hypothetical protein
VILMIAGIELLKRTRMDTRRHIESVDANYTLLDQGIGASNGGDGGGHSQPVLVPKDPQAYAKAMAPKK